MNESDFVIGSDAFINPNMSQLSVDHPSKERLKIKSKREPKHPHSQKSIEKLYDDFDWYGDDDIYDLIGTTGKIEVIWPF